MGKISKSIIIILLFSICFIVQAQVVIPDIFGGYQRGREAAIQDNQRDLEMMRIYQQQLNQSQQLTQENTNQAAAIKMKNEKIAQYYIIQRLNARKSQLKELGFGSSSISNMLTSPTAKAKAALGVSYEVGVNGVDKDIPKALSYYQLAAQQGNAIAQSNLCSLSLDGFAITSIEIVKFCELSAQQNYAIGVNNLGALYLQGVGVQKNIEKALSLFERAGNLGFIRAYDNAGRNYIVILKDYSKGFESYKAGARVGDPMSLYQTGANYYYGWTVPKSYKHAYFFWLLASSKGATWAVVERDYVEKQLSTEDIKIVQSAAVNWNIGKSFPIF